MKKSLWRLTFSLTAIVLAVALVAGPVQSAFAYNTLGSTRMHTKVVIHYVDGSTGTLENSVRLLYRLDIFSHENPSKAINKIDIIYEVRSTNPDFKAVTSNAGFIAQVNFPDSRKLQFDNAYLRQNGDTQIKFRQEGGERIWQVLSTTLTATELAQKIAPLADMPYYTLFIRVGGDLIGQYKYAERPEQAYKFIVEGDEWVPLKVYFDGIVPAATTGQNEVVETGQDSPGTTNTGTGGQTNNPGTGGSTTTPGGSTGEDPVICAGSRCDGEGQFSMTMLPITAGLIATIIIAAGYGGYVYFKRK